MSGYDFVRLSPIVRALYAWPQELFGVEGRQYYIAMTTSGGLYRYMLGDVVEISGRYRSTPRLRFLRKAGASCNLAGEKLDEVHVNEPFRRALERTGLEATWFSLAPEPGHDRPGYGLYIELAPASAASAGRLSSLVDLVDEELGHVAVTYGRLRRGMQLAPLVARSVPVGSFDMFRQQSVLKGAADAQIKTAHLVDDVNRIPSVLRDRTASLLHAA